MQEGHWDQTWFGWRILARGTNRILRPRAIVLQQVGPGARKLTKESYRSKWDQELENLRKQVKELEIELRGWHCRRDCEGSSDDPNYTGGGAGESSHCSGLCWLRDRSHETMGHYHDSLYRDRREHHNAALDNMSWVLRRVAWSPFSSEIKSIEMLRGFNRPPFTCYDGKTNLMEHVSHS